MKALVQDGTGSADVFNVRDVDRPLVTEGRVLVKVRAASVNALDWHSVHGGFVMNAIGKLMRQKDIPVRDAAARAGAERDARAGRRGEAGRHARDPRSGRQRVRPLTRPEAGVVFYMASSSRDDLVVLKDLIETGKIRPAIDRTYPLSEGAEAVRYVGTGQARAKVVITMDPLP